MPERILVIKLGALGDFVQAIGPFSAIRSHHSDGEITLLTTNPYVELALASGQFNQIWVDQKPRIFGLNKWLDLRRQLRTGGFGRVYDLQTSDRSSFYRRLFWPGQNPEWSGIAAGCSHPHANPRRDFMHTIERQAEQLQMTGIDTVPGPDSISGLSGLDAPIDQFGLKDDYALLAPGGAAHRPEKRWPVEKFAELANRLAARGLIPVLLGGSGEASDLDDISAACPQVVNLCGRTSLLEIAGLARRAKASVGNDTGPMHLIAAMGCPCVVLYSEASDPALCGQRGGHVSYLRKPNLRDLDVAEVEGMPELA